MAVGLLIRGGIRAGRVIARIARKKSVRRAAKKAYTKARNYITKKKHTGKVNLLKSAKRDLNRKIIRRGAAAEGFRRIKSYYEPPDEGLKGAIKPIKIKKRRKIRRR